MKTGPTKTGPLNFSEILKQLLRREDLRSGQMRTAMRALMCGEMSPAQLSAFLVALTMKGESVTELRSAVEVMRDMMEPLPIEVEGLVDTCGTGGDGARTFNISTAAAVTAAAAGVRVAKHGNRAVSGHCGSADLLHACGVNLELPPAAVAACIARVGLGFLFAPRFHPAMRYAAPVRRDLGVRTLFNKLGPLANPSGARRQVLGVYARELLRPLAEVLAGLGAEHVLVVHGRDGLDEISLSGETDACEWRAGVFSELCLTPEQVGLQRAPLETIQSNSPEHSLQLFREALAGSHPQARDIVLLNAGAAIYVAGREPTLAEAVAVARTVIEEGKAIARLEEFVSNSHALGEPKGS